MEEINSVSRLIEKTDCLMLQQEIPLEASVQAAKIAREKGKIVVWDPAPAGELPNEAYQFAQVMVPNQIEAEYLTGITDIILENITDEKKVHIVKNDKGIWVLPGYYFLPVEFSKLDNFISSLLKADILRYVTSKKERIERLEFSKHKIILKVNEETVWSIETGKRGQSGGLFIQFNNEADVYLVDITSYFDSNVDNWPEKQMLPFKPSDVATLSIDFYNQEHGFKVKRET